MTDEELQLLRQMHSPANQYDLEKLKKELRQQNEAIANLEERLLKLEAKKLLGIE